jgi:hypothetical protein
VADSNAEATWQLDPDRNVWAIFGDERFRDVLDGSLQSGEGRFGWSYVETADLRSLQERIERGGRSSSTEKEKRLLSTLLVGYPTR